MTTALSAAERKAWLSLEHVGPATVRDLERLGMRQLEDLARREPRELYDRLCRLTEVRQDACVLDVFSMLCSRARGERPRPWWEFSRERLAAEKQQRPRPAPAPKSPARRVSGRPDARA